ncbi:hypothetical protein [Chromobacterium amazonense]|uniref:hypothetical protein n=1 Tax=Chromobacterium amazonense TaxID=1382803 RepID=UPI0031F72041
MQIDVLIEILQEAIKNLTDREIVDMDLCEIGLAVFPKLNRAIASPCFTDGSWHFDPEIRTGWIDLYGEGYPVRWLPVLILLDNGEIEKIAHFPHQTVDKPLWVKQQAHRIRATLVEAIPDAAKQLASELKHN